MELELRSVERQGAHEVGGRALHPRGQGVGPLALILFASIFYIFQKLSPWIFRSFREILFSAQ